MAKVTSNSKLEKKIDELAKSTQQGINNLAKSTKQGFDAVDKRFVAVERKQEEMNNKFDKKFDQILTVIDGLAKKVDDFQTELAANAGAHDRFDQKITILEKRLDRVEAKVARR